jgi:hypothetical protein
VLFAVNQFLLPNYSEIVRCQIRMSATNLFSLSNCIVHNKLVFAAELQRLSFCCRIAVNKFLLPKSCCLQRISFAIKLGWHQRFSRWWFCIQQICHWWICVTSFCWQVLQQFYISELHQWLKWVHCVIMIYRTLEYELVYI